MIDVSAITNELRLDALDDSMSKKIKLDTADKYLRASGKLSDTEEFKLSFTGSMTNLTFNFGESPPSSLTILIRPSGTGSPFEPFRLLVADTRPQHAPVILSKSFLSADQPNFETTVDDRVRKRLTNIFPPRGAKWELRAFVTANEQLRKLALTNGAGISLRPVQDDLTGRIEATKSIDDLHHVSLEVVQGFSRLELIRFTDPPKKP